MFSTKLRMPACCAVSSPSSCTSKRRAAKSKPSACVTSAGSSSLAAKFGGGRKNARGSGTAPSARSSSASRRAPQRCPSPSRGSFRSSPTVLIPMLLKNSASKRVTPTGSASKASPSRSEEHTSELQSPCNLVCRLLPEKNNHLGTRHHPVHSDLARAGQDAARGHQPRSHAARGAGPRHHGVAAERPAAHTPRRDRAPLH